MPVPANTPGVQPFLAGHTVASGQVSVSSRSGSSFLLSYLLLWHQQELLGWLVCAQEEVMGGRPRTLGTHLGRREGLVGGLPAHACSSRRGLLLQHPPIPPGQASVLGRPSPSSPDTSCTGTAPDGSLALGTKATLCPALGWLQAGSH